MREILFRGKRLDNGEWIDGFYTCFMNKEHRIYNGYAETDCGDYYPDWWSVDPATVGQYTGMRDKNGKRIFEGDIVQHDFELEQIGVQLAVVRYSTEYNPAYVLNPIDDWMCADWRECEVVGNIYHDPKLLEEVNDDDKR